MTDEMDCYLLDEVGLETEFKDIQDAAAANLTAAHGYLFPGCSDDAENAMAFPEEFEDYEVELDGMDLRGMLPANGNHLNGT